MGLAVDDEVDEVIVVVTVRDSVGDDVGLTGSLAVGDEVVETVIGEAVGSSVGDDVGGCIGLPVGGENADAVVKRINEGRKQKGGGDKSSM